MEPGGIFWDQVYEHYPNILLPLWDTPSKSKLCKLYRLIRSPFKLFSCFNGYKPNIVYSGLYGANAWSSFCKKRMNFKLIWGIRSTVFKRNLLGTIYFIIGKYYSNTPNLVISNSIAGLRAHRFHRYFSTARFRVIPNGIDTSKFIRKHDYSNKWREIWNIPQTTKIIGTVGRLHPIKGYLGLLNTAKILKQNNVDFVWIIIGKRNKHYFNKLMKHCFKLNISNKILWVGESDKVHEQYNLFDLYCFTSIAGEGFPNVLGEAMSYNIPIIATSEGDSAYILGDYGKVISTFDSKVYANEIIKFFEGNKLVCRNSRDRIVKFFSVENCIDQSIKAIEHLM